jgi:hypothetical protein
MTVSVSKQKLLDTFCPCSTNKVYVQRPIMRFSSLVSFAIAGACICTALPRNLTNFLLVTTSQIDPSANTSELKAVSATSLFVSPSNHSLPPQKKTQHHHV